MKNVHNYLQAVKQQNLYRQPRTVYSAQEPEMLIDGKPVLAFCSNNYLGLAHHPKVITAFQKTAEQYGVGTGAAHLINGHTTIHQQLEEELAAFTGRERALLFSTGYMANIGVISALCERQDVIYGDRLNHASLLDAAQLSRAKALRYAHKDMAQLEMQLSRQEKGDSLIVSDGVFSMDGDIASIAELIPISQAANALLMIDDAHGFGVLGKQGIGCVEDYPAEAVPIFMATLGKALGTAGAFVAGSEESIEYLVQTARSYIFTTAMPAAVAAATRCSLQLVAEESWRRDKLQHLIAYFRRGADELALPLMPSETAIQPLLVGTSEQALKLSQCLWQKNILATAIRPPTVPQNTARLRITLSAQHTEIQINKLLEALDNGLRRT